MLADNDSCIFFLLIFILFLRLSEFPSLFREVAEYSGRGPSHSFFPKLKGLSFVIEINISLYTVSKTGEGPSIKNPILKGLPTPALKPGHYC